MPHDPQPLLDEFARRLRALRASAGLSVSDLAREAGVSRRHITEAEAGRANPSLQKLDALARGLGVGLGRLCDLGGGPRRRTRRIALVGLRGAGKSTLGRLLARRLEVPFVELDRRVEEAAGIGLAEVFELQGASAFHELEAEALEGVLREGDALVLSTGGSVVESPATFERLRETCRTVWLRASPEEHYRRVVEQGDRRPMRDRPRAMEELRELLAAREVEYGRCELRLETEGRRPEELVLDLEERLG